jgi:hypothetical protein
LLVLASTFSNRFSPSPTVSLNKLECFYQASFFFLGGGVKYNIGVGQGILKGESSLYH